MKVVQVQNTSEVADLESQLDRGEAEAIVLAQEMQAALVLMDERRGRRALSARNMAKIGTVGLLLKAKQAGLLAKVKPDLDRLRERQFRISETLYKTILDEANEAH